MSKSFKLLSAIGLALTLIVAVTWAQLANAEKSADTEHYKEALRSLFSANTIAYDYQAKFDLEDSSGFVSSGKMIKSGQDFIDSNEQYYKIMSGNIFLNVDLGMRSVFVVDIQKMEKSMGFVRSDLNSALFNVSDSNYASLGTWTLQGTSPDGADLVVFKVSDTADQPVSEVAFTFRAMTLEKMEVHFTNYGDIGSGARNMVVRMYNFNTGNMDLQKPMSEVVRLDGPGKPVLLNKFSDFELKQL